MNNVTNPLSSKLVRLYIGLTAFFIGNALIAEYLGVKIFSVEKTLGLISGLQGNINMSIGTIIWPFVFITSDLLNEYFGKKGVKMVSFVTASIIAYSSIVILIGNKLPPAQFWLDANHVDNTGKSFNINYAYNIIFRQGIGIVIGSITAFLVSQLIDVYVFHYFRNITGHRFLWVRATGSTVVSQILDSFLILFIAFYLLGNWTFSQVLSVGVVQYFYKVGLAIVFTPLIYLAHKIIDRYLGKQVSKNVVDKANENW